MNQGGMGFSRKLNTGAIPVFQGIGKDIQLAQGGFLLNVTGLAVGDVIAAGTPVIYDESTRVVTVMHAAIAQADAGGSATAYQVKKGHTLKVGDYLASGATGGKAYAITAIDTTTSTEFDTITVGTTIGAVTAGSTLYASTATGATASALPAINGLLYEERVVENQNVSCSVAIRATVYARRVPYSAAIEAKLAASSPRTALIYSNSY